MGTFAKAVRRIGIFGLGFLRLWRSIRFFGSGLKHTMAILRTKLSMGRPRKRLGDTMQMQAIKEELSRIIGNDYSFQHKVTGNKVTILLVSHRFEKSCLERECLELEIKGMISRNLPKGMVLDLHTVPGERPSVPPYYIGGCI